MTQKELVLDEIEQLPDSLLADVLQYIQGLKATTSREALETAQASEQVLAKDWLRDEEDEAWQNL